MVAILLLHAGGQPRLRAQVSGRDQAWIARHSQGGRSLRQRAGAVAQRLVDRGFTDRYDYAVDALTSIPYGAWREYNPEDTVRYYALRLNETGFIKSSPNKIIAESTDWRFFNELKRELKG